MKTTDINFNNLKIENLPQYEIDGEITEMICEVELPINNEDDFSLIISYSVDSDLTVDDGDYYNPPSESGWIKSELDIIQVYKDGDIVEFDCSFFGRGTELFKNIEDVLSNNYDSNL